MIRVCALYRFASFPDPAALRAPLLALAEAQGIRGTLLLAREGINGTVAGRNDAIEALLDHIRTLPGCADLDYKDSAAEAMPFHRMKVRLKREIVSMGVEGVDPTREVGTYLSGEAWNALIAEPDTLLIDTRNDYEVAIGTFDGAVDPGTRSFRDFPSWFREHRDALMAGKSKVAMFCTGGIRCEKATAFLKAEGVEDVFHLDGGILKYLETVPEEQSRWTGECFVFDARVAVGHGLTQGSHGLCHGCRMPVGPQDRASPLYVEGVSCPACHGTRDAERLAAYAERHRQETLAAARGVAHVGARFPSPDADRDEPTAP